MVNTKEGDAQDDMIKEVVGWVSIIGVIFIIISNKRKSIQINVKM